ncbi:MAG TPA: response regulator transcription factor [Anaerolineales bacterium]|nr:response regulator transcription factor [Anaerolineales bacterium]
MTKIMVVDDDEDFTNLYKTTLRMKGYDITAVNESPAAMDMAYLVKPDVFLIDLMMPDIDGIQLCRMIREDPVFKLTPIIIVTALTDSESNEVAMGAGANGYLAKPFQIDELISKINALAEGTE